MGVVLGIDPGANGAIAVLDEAGEIQEVHDMPSTPEANGRSFADTRIAELFIDSRSPKAGKATKGQPNRRLGGKET
jgi:hypothetical protein